MDGFEDLGFIPESSKDDMSDLGFVPESSPIEEAPTSSALEAVGRGALQSGTAGFAEELGAGMLAAPTYVASALQNLVSPQSVENVDEQLLKQGFTGDLQQKQSLLDTYRNLRDVARQRQAQVESERPLESLAGNVLGAAATIPLMPAGAGLRAGKAALEAGKGIKAARTAAGLAEGGQLAGLTALEAAGASEADLTKGDILGLAEDIAKGELVTGSVMALGKGTKKAAQAGMKVAKYIPWAEDIVDSFNAGMRDVDLARPIREFESKLNELGQDVVTFTKQQLKNFGEIKEQIKKEADDAGLTFDVSGFFNKYRTEIEDLPAYGSKQASDKKALLKELDIIESNLDEVPSSVPFSKVDDLKGPLRGLSIIGDDNVLKTPEYASLATKMSKDLSDQLKTHADNAGITGYGINEKNYSIFKDLEDVLGFKEKYSTKEKSQSIGKLRELFEKLEKPTPAGGKARDAAEAAFERAETVAPGLKERVLETGKELGKDLQLARKVQSPGLIEGAVKGRVLMGGANVAGRAVRSAQEYTPQLLQDLIQKAPKYADQLNRALGADTKKRNAIMFGLMQNPEFRKAIGADNMEESE